MVKKSLNETSPVARFEQSLEELEQLVQKMEVGDQSLEQSLTAYERGIGLYRDCQQALEQAELRVRMLTDPARRSGRSLRTAIAGRRLSEFGVV